MKKKDSTSTSKYVNSIFYALSEISSCAYDKQSCSKASAGLAEMCISSTYKGFLVRG